MTNFAPLQEYHADDPPILLILFDLNDPAAVERLRREQSGWRGFANAEKLDAEHAVLVIRPGAALGESR